jgi:hypothetical protein
LTPKPYEDILHIQDPFERNNYIKQVAEHANIIQFKGFTKSLQSYQQSLKVQQNTINIENVTQFDNQPLDLNAGDWRADEWGVSRHNGQFEEIACSHPILPIEKLKNIDTGELKVKLAFRRSSKDRKIWTEQVVGMDTISNAKNILDLAKIGVSVSSGKKAQCLVDYLNDVIDLNYDLIPQKMSVNRMGWNEEGFSPYVKDVIFDGDKNFNRIFKTLFSHGSPKKWLDEAVKIRSESVQAKILLAASFASVLLEPLGLLPFFVHLWGSESGTGKTVGLMFATSVWANPELGRYIQTFRSTSVGVEFIAGFLNSLPVVIDELQLAKDNKGKVIFDVYVLAAGVGKLRGTKTLGIAETLTWANCFLTSGETPIINDSDGAGAFQRVIEIECKTENKIIKDGLKTSNILKNNYGFAGQIFIRKLREMIAADPDELKRRYEKISKEMLKEDTGDKQALSASVLLLADTLATEWVFKDDNGLKFAEVSETLKTKASSNIGDRAYSLLCDWVAGNGNKLRKQEQGEIYGCVENGFAYIIPSVVNKVLSEAGFNAKSVLSQLRSKKLIKTDGASFSKMKRINDVSLRCVCLILPCDDEFIDEVIPL